MESGLDVVKTRDLPDGRFTYVAPSRQPLHDATCPRSTLLTGQPHTSSATLTLLLVMSNPTLNVTGATYCIGEPGP